jgi:hypothetical protein
VIASSSVTILNLAAQTSPQVLRSRHHSEGDPGTPLTNYRVAFNDGFWRRAVVGMRKSISSADEKTLSQLVSCLV